MNIKVRVNVRLRASIIFGFICAFLMGGAHAQSPLASQLEIFQVQQQRLAGQIYEQLTEVQSVSPGAHLEYVLTYRNVSDQVLAGFDIQSPIPLNTFYIQGTAEVGAEYQFQVSLDGGNTWLDEPVMQASLDAQGMEVVEEVSTRSYTDLRWRISSVLAPEQQVQIRYRVQVR